MNIKDMKTIANLAIAVMDDISVEAANLRVFCHEVVDAIESEEGDFKIVTLDGNRATVTYLALKARIVELAESIPISVPVVE